MENFTDNDVLKEWAKMKKTELEQNDPWLVYVAEKSRTSCMKCQENHAKRFRSSDDSKPKLPIHPNCKCKYVPLDEATAQMTMMRSIKVVVTGAPGRGDFKISSIDGMLVSLEKECLPGTLGELIIIGHGNEGGKFEMGDRTERFDLMSDRQIERLYKLLSPNALIDIRMCYGIKNEHGENVVQGLANKLRCKVRAYKNKVSPFGTRPFPYGEETFSEIFEFPEGKTFYPK